MCPDTSWRPESLLHSQNDDRIRWPPPRRPTDDCSPNAKSPSGPWRLGLDSWTPRDVGDNSHSKATRQNCDDAHGPETAIVPICTMCPANTHGYRLSPG